jgi:hypothetical protein
MPPRNGIVINIGANGTEAKEVLAMVQEQLRETGRVGKEESEGLREAFETIKGAIEAAGIAELGMMVAEAAAKIKELIASSVELGMELGHAAQETGISAQNLSVLKYASDVTGVSFEALVKGTGRLSKAMLEAEEGKKASIQSFARLGISQQQVTEHSNDMLGMLGMVADRFEALPDGPQKAAVAISLFGKAGMGMIPFLNQGSKGIAELEGETKALGLVLDEEGIAKLEEMHHAAQRMQGAVEGVGLGLAVGLEPAVESVSSAIAAFAGGTAGWVAIGQQAGNAAIYFAAGITEIVRWSKLAQNEIRELIGDAGELAAREESFLAITSSQKAAAAAHLAESQKMVADAKINNVLTNALADFTESNLAEGLNGGTPSKEKKKKRPGHIDLQDQSEGGKSTDGIAKAQASLAAAQAEAIAKVIKDADDGALVANEAWHKLMLISDEEFYAEKLRLEMQSIDAEETALNAKRGELEALLAKQQGDKLLKRDKSGQSAEELTTKREILQLDGQINKLESDRTKLQINNSLELQLHAQQDQLAILKIAAQVEAETNTTITARLALMRAENALAIQKAGTGSPEASQLQALERVKEAKLEIGDIDRQIREIEQNNKVDVGVLQDRANKDPRQRLAVTKEINQLNAQTAAQLKDLVAQYDALAATLGGPFIQTAKNLHAEMDKLNTPNKKQDADFTKTLGDGITHMAEQIGSASLSGRDSFHQMVQSMEKDVVELAIKLAAQKWLTPFLNGLGGGGGGDVGGSSVGDPGSLLGGYSPGEFADGGDPTGPSIVGEKGPELFFPKGPGTIMPDPELFFPKDGMPSMPSGALSELSRSSAGGGSPNTTVNITNASSQPVTARQTGSSFDADTKSYMTHVILEDLSQGGPISSALRPGG